VRWSFVHFIEDLNTPKMRAVDSLNGMERAPVTFGRAVPASIRGDSMSLSYVNSGAFIRPPSWRSYVIRVDQAGTYGVTVGVSNVQSGTVAICVDGVLVGTTTPTGTGTTPKYTVALAPGLHGVMVRCTAGAFNIDRVNVSVESYSSVMANAGTAGKRGSRPVMAAVNGRLRLRLEHGSAYTLCTIQGRTVVSGTFDASTNVPSIGSGTARTSNGVYILHSTQANAAGMLVR
jgi:hypothetical protein